MRRLDGGEGSHLAVAATQIVRGDLGHPLPESTPTRPPLEFRPVHAAIAELGPQPEQLGVLGPRIPAEPFDRVTLGELVRANTLHLTTFLC
jgi:hypothetical protein